MIPGHGVSPAWYAATFDVWALEHVHEAKGCTLMKLLGIFMDEHAALEAADTVRGQPGFCETPEGFRTRKLTVYAPRNAAAPVNGSEVHYAYYDQFDADETGVEHETIYESVLYTCKAGALEELAQWEADGLIENEECAGISSWSIGRIEAWREGFETYYWQMCSP